MLQQMCSINMNYFAPFDCNSFQTWSFPWRDDRKSGARTTQSTQTLIDS